MNGAILGVTLALLGAFDLKAPPEGWEVKNTKGLTAQGPITPLPIDATVRVKPALKSWVYVNVITDGQEVPLLSAGLLLQSPTRVMLSGKASGVPMAGPIVSTRSWSQQQTPTGAVFYDWRFPLIRNLWDDRDRNEIGSSYQKLTPLDEKLIAVRVVVTEQRRQIWVDGRLVGEHVGATTGPARLAFFATGGSVVESVESNPAVDHGRFTPVPLDDYRSDGKALPAGTTIAAAGALPPVQLMSAKGADLDLGDSLYRYRLTIGSGPDAGYVNAQCAWPGAFTVDPAILALRVPYRDYRNVYLAVWLDDEPDSVPTGAVRFFREDAGYPAQSDFEVNDAAIKAGLVRKLDQTAPNGKPLYLVRVPVNTDDLYGMRDTAGEVMDLQITKPLSLSRSYPDPIYYGRHPAGLPSSVHVVGVTLEEGSFGYEVTPAQIEHVFESNETPTYTVPVTNHTAAPLSVVVTFDTTSYDGTQKTRTMASARDPINPNATGTVNLALDKITRFGWHELRITVTSGEETRSNTLSLLKLPPNRRTYGLADNETRFGLWMLLGHYTPFWAYPEAKPRNEQILAMLRKLGMRRVAGHGAFFDADMLTRHDYLRKGAHTIVSYYRRLNMDDADAVAKWLEAEKVSIGIDKENSTAAPTYYYGGEWNYDHHYSYAMLPRYSGGGEYVFSDVSLANLRNQMRMFYAVGAMLREKSPKTKLILQWGAPMNTLGFLQEGFDDKLVDAYGMDAPMFELTPEVPSVVGTINGLWQLRQEIGRLGRRQLPIAWCEGPFFPTNEGAMSMQEQEENQIRYWLLGLAYGIENFEAGVVPHDAGNYYGAEHYGAGVFHRYPLECPKPAAAAIATATNMLCGADVVGGMDTGVLTTHCMAFKRADGPLYALWRVIGQSGATLTVGGAGPAVLTDAMGNETKLPVTNGKVKLNITSSPQWLTGVSSIDGFAFDAPVYDDKPAAVTLALPAFNGDRWRYDGSDVETYAKNHFGQTRLTDPQLTATFGNSSDHGPAANVTLAAQAAGDRPLPQRYGAIVLDKPAEIPGKASNLGVWINGNSSWGRIAYQLRDANGELWTSIGTKDDWNADDTHTWSFVKFEGWRYVRFPLPGNHPWDAARETETTWWKHEGGDGIVDLPLSVDKIFVEARNESHYLAQMKLVSNRTYQLAGLVAEYDSAEMQSPGIYTAYRLRKQQPTWPGPTGNLIAEMTAANEGEAPAIERFEEPGHFNDGRRMILRVKGGEATPDVQYQLYLSRAADGRGAEAFGRPVKHGVQVTGFRPGVTMYLFMTRLDGKKESKPSAEFELVTEDKFREK